MRSLVAPSYYIDVQEKRIIYVSAALDHWTFQLRPLKQNSAFVSAHFFLHSIRPCAQYHMVILRVDMDYVYIWNESAWESMRARAREFNRKPSCALMCTLIDSYRPCLRLNPLHSKGCGDQFWISPCSLTRDITSHSMKIRTWLFIAYSDETWLFCRLIPSTILIHFSLRVGRMCFLTLEVKGLDKLWPLSWSHNEYHVRILKASLKIFSVFVTVSLG